MALVESDADVSSIPRFSRPHQRLGTAPKATRVPAARYAASQALGPVFDGKIHSLKE